MATVRTTLKKMQDLSCELLTQHKKVELFSMYPCIPGIALSETRDLRETALRVVDLADALIRRFESELAKKPTARS